MGATDVADAEECAHYMAIDNHEKLNEMTEQFEEAELEVYRIKVRQAHPDEDFSCMNIWTLVVEGELVLEEPSSIVKLSIPSRE
ncbi:unnamed protein product [Lupinus luteus]|uniref:Uncharacterized protein n=1 Tax=Lupinus luteus TaxID=3873 RepID=A0AAV1W761_LUPLU